MSKSEVSCCNEDDFIGQETSLHIMQCECHASPSCSHKQTQLGIGNHLQNHLCMPVSVVLNDKKLCNARQYLINTDDNDGNHIKIIVKQPSSILSEPVVSEEAITLAKPVQTRNESNISMGDASRIRIYRRPSIAYTALVDSQHSSFYDKFSGNVIKNSPETKLHDNNKRMAVIVDPRNLSQSRIQFQEPLCWHNSKISSSEQVLRKRKGKSKTVPLRIGQHVCSSMQFDVTQAKTRLRHKIEHPNRKVAEQLGELGVDNILRACRPAKCCRQAVLNEESDPAMPYSASLRSLPLSLEDIAVIKKSLRYSQLRTEAKTKACKEKLSYYVELGQEDMLRYANSCKKQEQKLYRVETVEDTASKELSAKWASFYNLLQKLDTERNLFERIYDARGRSLNHIGDKRSSSYTMTDSMNKVRYSTSSMSISFKIRMKKEETRLQGIKRNTKYVTENKRTCSAGTSTEKRENVHDFRKVVERKEKKRLKYCLNVVNKKDENKSKRPLWTIPKFYEMYLNRKDKVPMGMRLCGGKDAPKDLEDDFICFCCHELDKRQQLPNCGSSSRAKFHIDPNKNEIPIFTCTTGCSRGREEELKSFTVQAGCPDHLATKKSQRGESNESVQRKVNLCWPGPQITLTLTAVKGTLVNASKEKMCLVSLKQSTPQQTMQVDNQQSQTGDPCCCGRPSGKRSSLASDSQTPPENARRGKCKYWPDNCERPRAESVKSAGSGRRSSRSSEGAEGQTKDEALETERAPQKHSSRTQTVNEDSMPKRDSITQTPPGKSSCHMKCTRPEATKSQMSSNASPKEKASEERKVKNECDGRQSDDRSRRKSKEMKHRKTDATDGPPEQESSSHREQGDATDTHRDLVVDIREEEVSKPQQRDQSSQVATRPSRHKRNLDVTGNKTGTTRNAKVETTRNEKMETTRNENKETGKAPQRVEYWDDEEEEPAKPPCVDEAAQTPLLRKRPPKKCTVDKEVQTLFKFPKSSSDDHCDKYPKYCTPLPTPKHLGIREPSSTSVLKSEPKSVREPEPKSMPESEPEPKSMSKRESKSVPKAKPKIEPVPEPEPKREPKSVPKAKSKPKIEPMPEPEPKREPKSAPKALSKPTFEPEPKPKSEHKREARFAPKIESKFEPESEPESKSEAEPEPKSEPESNPPEQVYVAQLAEDDCVNEKCPAETCHRGGRGSRLAQRVQFQTLEPQLSSDMLELRPVKFNEEYQVKMISRGCGGRCDQSDDDKPAEQEESKASVDKWANRPRPSRKDVHPKKLPPELLPPKDEDEDDVSESKFSMQDGRQTDVELKPESDGILQVLKARRESIDSVPLFDEASVGRRSSKDSSHKSSLHWSENLTSESPHDASANKKASSIRDQHKDKQIKKENHREYSSEDFFSKPPEPPISKKHKASEEKGVKEIREMRRREPGVKREERRSKRNRNEQRIQFQNKKSADVKDSMDVLRTHMEVETLCNKKDPDAYCKTPCKKKQNTCKNETCCP